MGLIADCCCTEGAPWENSPQATGNATDSYQWDKVEMPTEHGKIIQVSAGKLAYKLEGRLLSLWICAQRSLSWNFSDGGYPFLTMKRVCPGKPKSKYTRNGLCDSQTVWDWQARKASIKNGLMCMTTVLVAAEATLGVTMEGLL